MAKFILLNQIDFELNKCGGEMHMVFNFCQFRYFSVCLIFVLFPILGCSSGPMEVRETHYYAVPNQDHTNINYYRLQVKADTRLGDAEYRSGWFPTRAVDNVFGDVSMENGVKILETRTALEGLINEKILSTTKNWLDAAENPDSPDEKLDSLSKARMRVLAYPRIGAEPYPGTIEIEYNPAKGVAQYHSDEKLIFILSSNPDEIIGEIANFAESEKTALAINQMAKLFSQQSVNKVASNEAVEEVNLASDKNVVAQIDLVLDSLERFPAKNTAIMQTQTLINQIDSVQP